MPNLNWVLHFSLTFGCILCIAQTSDERGSPPCSEPDRAALLSFKARILNDTTGILSSWTGPDCCGAWEGIECHPETGRVIGLQLQRSRPQGNGSDALFMKGILSPSLGSLQFLESMVVSGMKQIRGAIPESLSRLTHLTQLYLEDNMLEGTIPSSLGKLTLLKALSLSGNRLQGQLPTSLGSLIGLIQFNVGRNLLNGSIPPSFKNFRGLQSLDLSYNLLSGEIPKFIGQSFQNLTFLDFSNNQFSGEIPLSLFTMFNALDISLSHNKLTGQLQSQIGNLKSLNTLSLSNNLLTGKIPDSIAGLQKLWYLNLSRNGFLDPLPVALAKGLPSLQSIDLSYNSFHLGTIPDWITRREMRDIHLAGCNISGTLSTFQNQDSLNSIVLSDNYLTGGIKDFITKIPNVQHINLSTNTLRFDISGLLLPDGLSSLDLHSNQIYGSVSGLFQNSTMFLEFMDLSNNIINGTLPEFSNSLALKWLDLSRNGIKGLIPLSISYLTKLERLDISRNQLRGSIPSSMGKMTSLRWLDLSSNLLTGKIPDSFLGLGNIKHASFRANRLCGQIPQGRPFQIFPASAYTHNQCLCGKPLPPCRGRF